MSRPFFEALSFGAIVTGAFYLFGWPAATMAETVVYSQGFESNNGSYMASWSLTTWEWGAPSPAFTAGPTAAHSGSKCWGTDLDDTVPFNSNAYLISPAITLPALNANEVMRVRFWAWIAVDYMYDRGEFQVSWDGMDWETKAELLCVMQGGWNEYSFDISDYAGDVIYLRFRCRADGQNIFNPPTIPYNMAGLYIDDIAITVATSPSVKKILTFEGQEYQSLFASCPWICIKNGDGWKKENDIYSTARGSALEYTDFYRLNRKLTPNNNGKFVIKLKETEQEESYTDLFHLIAIDHAANVEIACDENGGIFTYKNKKNPLRPVTVTDKNGVSVDSLLNNTDDMGYTAYNGDYIDLDFGAIGNASHPIFLLRVKGFLVDTLPGAPMIGVQPKIEIQTQKSNGNWKTRNVFFPRWKYSLCGYDMAGFFPYSKKIRLLSSSCHSGKYHRIDWAVLSTQPQKSVTITELEPVSAVRSDGAQVAAALSAEDGERAYLCTGEAITIKFNEPPKADTAERDFIIKSKGYYNPTGTYFFYTWDGSKWAQRDGWSVPLAGDMTREFDLSLWLPDPAGKNRVRIWQDFFYDPAAIDYIGLRRDDIDLVMSEATDLRTSTSVLSLLNASDDQRLSWDFGVGRWTRDRWVEVGWIDTFVNTPPSTHPVFVTNTGSPTPTINWTYFDIDGNPQEQYEIEVWSEPDGNGNNFWDPAPGSGTAASEIYAGLPLSNGRAYYARVKAYDGVHWGGWSEAPFAVGSNRPPIAEAGPDRTIIASPICSTSVALDGSASYDPDGDTLSFLWTGPFGAASGRITAVFLYPGVSLIKLIVSDGKGGTGMDSVTVIVRDTVPPEPDSASLPAVTGECSVIISNPPTATDNCAGTIVGVTDSLVFTNPGVYVVTWRYDDGNGNVSWQSQNVIVSDATPPVPDLAVLPEIREECNAAVRVTPTATDNCAGQIFGTTADPLYYSQKGTYTITWKYEDESGNVATQQQTVTVIDDAFPTPDISPLPALNGSCVIAIHQFPTANDDCAGIVVGTTADPLVYAKTGTYTISWRYDDGNGNVATQPQTVIITDNTPPVPAVSPLPVKQGDCKVKICKRPTATDDCKGRIVGTTTDPLSYTKQGTYTILWKYDDGNGNVSTQTQTVIVDDNGAPVPNVNPLPVKRGECSARICGKPTATDNCKGRIVGTTTDPLSYTKQGTYTILWKYDDGNGNVTTQTQTVIVDDNGAPVPDVNPLPVIYGTLGHGCVCSKCFKIKCYPTALDNCKGKIVGTTSSPLKYCNKGNFTIIWKYDDGNGNITTQVQSVIIR